MSGVCSQGKWRRFFLNSTGKMNPISECTQVHISSRAVIFIPGVMSIRLGVNLSELDS